MRRLWLMRSALASSFGDCGSEGLTLRDLVRPTRQHLVRDLIRGVFILAPVAIVVGIFTVLYSILSATTALQEQAPPRFSTHLERHGMWSSPC